MAERKSRRREPGVLDLKALKPDRSNRRRRTARSASLLVESMREVGPARSVVIDENDELIVGNGAAEAAAEAGVTKVHVVEADGETLIAVRRRGLTAEQKRRLAMYDNRSAELSEWDPTQLASDVTQGLELQPFFTEGEARQLLKRTNGAEPQVEEVQTTDVADRFWISVRGPLKAQAAALQRLRELMKDLDGVQVELGTIALEEFIPV